MLQARDTAEECRQDLLLGFVLAKRLAVKRYIDDYKISARTFFKTRLDKELEAPLTLICGTASEYSRKIRYRLLQSPTCFRDELRRITDQVEDLYNRIVQKATDDQGWSRVPNGVELYDGESTVMNAFNAAVEREQQSHPGMTLEQVQKMMEARSFG